MRRILPALMLLIMLAPAMVRAQQEGILPVPQTQSSEVLESGDKKARTVFTNQYYNRCMTVRAPDVSEAVQSDTCMCHSVHMLELMPTPELELMATGKGTTNVSKKRLFVQIYAPCIEFMAYEQERERCYDSIYVKSLVKTQTEYENTCICVSNELRQLVRETAEAQMAAIMETNPILEDPLEGILGSIDFSMERDTIYRNCMNEYIE